MWICPGCGQARESDFQICWKCLTAREGNLGAGDSPRDSPDDGRALARRRHPAGMRACPQCGADGLREAMTVPLIFVPLRKDRLCGTCMLRISPSRPMWAVLSYLVALVALMLAGPPLLAACCIPGWNPAWVSDLCFPVVFLATQVLLLIVQLRNTDGS